MKGRKKQIVDGKLQCAKCLQWKAVCDFETSTYGAFGKASRCRECNGRIRPAGVLGRPPAIPVDGKLKCKKCGEWKPVDEMTKSAKCVSGRTRICKKCSSSRVVKSYGGGRGRKLLDPKRRFLGRLCSTLIHMGRQGEGKRTKAGFSYEMLNADSLFEIYEKQRGLCAATGIEMTAVRGQGKVLTNISIDRIDPSKGYENENVRLVCYAVNVMKHNMPEETFIFWINKLHSRFKDEPHASV